MGSETGIAFSFVHIKVPFGISLKDHLFFLLFSLILVLFMSLILLFQLHFNFIYSDFSKKFSILTK